MGGYDDVQLDTNRWRVSFASNYYRGYVSTKDFWLLRAATLANKAGYPYFIVLTGGPNTAREITNQRSFERNDNVITYEIEGKKEKPESGIYYHAPTIIKNMTEKYSIQE